MKLLQAKRRIILWSMVGILLTGTLVGVSALIPMTHSVREQIQLMNTVSVVAQSHAIENQMARYSSIAWQFTSRTEIRKRLDAFYANAIAFPELQRYTLPRLAEPAVQITDLMLLMRLTVDAEIIASAGPLSDASVAELLPTTLHEGTDFIVVNDEVLVRVVMPIKSRIQENTVIGFDVLYFETAELETLLSGFEAYGKEAQLFVVNHEYSQMLTYDIEEKRMVLATLNEEYRGYLTYLNEHVGILYNPESEETSSLIFIPFEDSSWGLLVKITNKALYQAASKALTSSVLSVALMLLVGGILSYYLVNPLVIQLIEQAKQIEKNTLQLRQAAEKMKNLAHTDGLTGLPNRIALMQHLEEAVERCTVNQFFAVLFIDLDKFKPVNDQYGHQVGDLLLQAVAGRLQNNIREEDVAGRLGGDEFLVVIEALSSPEQATFIAEKIVGYLSEPFFIENHALHIGGSIGVAIYPMHGNTVDGLIGAADQAMYQAKTAGSGRYVMAG